MGLFKKSYVDKIKDICVRLNDATLQDDDVLIKFNSKVKEIEKIDVEFIGFLEQIVKEGRISEKLKTALLNQLVFLLRRLESLKFEEKGEIPALKSAIEDVLLTELTVERLGVECHGLLYHGTGISGIKVFAVDLEQFDYLGSNTLGSGIYCTDDKKAGVSYGVHRYEDYLKDKDIITLYGNRIQPTLYTLRLKEGHNFIADLNDPIKIRSIYQDLLKYMLLIRAREQAKGWVVKGQINQFITHLQNVISTNATIVNFRYLLVENRSDRHRQIMRFIIEFLKELGYHGLRCVEGGEIVWEPGRIKVPSSMSYVIFDPADLEIVSEEHFKVVDGNIAKIK